MVSATAPAPTAYAPNANPATPGHSQRSNASPGRYSGPGRARAASAVNETQLAAVSTPG